MFEELQKNFYKPKLIVISGPSGVGKDTVLDRMKERELPFHFVVTATTREQRPNEIEGEDYFFLSKDEFLRMVREGEFFEHALVYDEYKGIPKVQIEEALESGRDVVMRVDVQGAETVRSKKPDAVLIFLSTSTEDELIRRLKLRRTETAEKLALRIESAREELMRVPVFDYYVVNRDEQLDKTVDTILAIVKAEHVRVHPQLER